MKISTYNIWDNEAGMPFRMQQLLDEIMLIDADILCLQEVASWQLHTKIASICNYKYAHYHERANLSVMCKTCGEPIKNYDFGSAHNIQFRGKSLNVVNVHLPWESILQREKTIVEIAAHTVSHKNDYKFLLGDFNSSPESSVHRFLTNQQSLLSQDAYFFDLAESYADVSNTLPQATLNFRLNPRWGQIQPSNTIEVNQRCDWIMLQNPYPANLPELKSFTVFGMKVAKETNLSASDHYGVVADLNI